MTQPSQSTAFQQKAGPLPSYRSIAIAPPKILPRPTLINEDKRKWSATLDNQNIDADLMLNKKQSKFNFFFLNK
jgi:hypothetical protein